MKPRDTLTLPAGSSPGRQHLSEETSVILDRVMHQVDHGLDSERLLPPREKQARDFEKKLSTPLQKNGYRIFVSNHVWTILNGKAPQQRSAERMLVETIRKWREQCADILPSHMDRLDRIIQDGFRNPTRSTHGSK